MPATGNFLFLNGWFFMFSPQRILNAFNFSMKGYKSAWQTEAAFRDNVMMVVITQLFCLFLQPNWQLWLFFCACNALLIIAELLNTGLEYLADHISTEHHEFLGRAKDVGSAAVFTALALNGLTLVVITWQALA